MHFCKIPGTIVLVTGGLSVDAGEVEVNSYFTPRSPWRIRRVWVACWMFLASKLHSSRISLGISHNGYKPGLAGGLRLWLRPVGANPLLPESGGNDTTLGPEGLPAVLAMVSLPMCSTCQPHLLRACGCVLNINPLQHCRGCVCLFWSFWLMIITNKYFHGEKKSKGQICLLLHVFLDFLLLHSKPL